MSNPTSLKETPFYLPLNYSSKLRLLKMNEEGSSVKFFPSEYSSDYFHINP